MVSLKRDRYRGCLIGGAIGDALGYPVEFLSKNYIAKKYGANGITKLSQAGNPAVVSDDTQMTLFASNGIIYSRKNSVDLKESVWCAYEEWLSTQGYTKDSVDINSPKMYIYKDKRLHIPRAPGDTCLSAIKKSYSGGSISCPINSSKGCGALMRSAPFGLIFRNGIAMNDISDIAVNDAALTHGNKMAWAASSVLSQIIFYIVRGNPSRDYRLEDSLNNIKYLPYCNLKDRLLNVVEMANSDISDEDAIYKIGEGWVAEETLSIALFCAIRYQNDFHSAICAAVNHDGDSDSTGSVCGNILGAWLGFNNISSSFDLEYLEMKDLILSVADDLYDAMFFCK